MTTLHQQLKTETRSNRFNGQSVELTKEEAIIDARRVISFRASKELKRRVNS